MASILRIGKSWRAQVRLAGKRRARTFATKAAAFAWARKAEGTAAARIEHVDDSDLTVSDLIQAYRDLREGGDRPIDDKTNEHYMLNIIEGHLGHLKAGGVSTRDLVTFCKARRIDGAAPYTINMDISKLGTVYRYAPAMLDDIKLPDVVGRARPALTSAGLIGGGGKRERRPTEDELTRLEVQLSPAMAEVLRFAVASAMRREEITLLRWADLDRKKMCIWIRDRKDPRNKKGNDQFVPLLGEAFDIVSRQAAPSDRIFPYHPQSITKAFTAACRALDIPDLHFHDMRHEGISRLFEQGYTIEQVALVSGHKDWRHLRRYTNLKPESLHHLHRKTKRPALTLVQ